MSEQEWLQKRREHIGASESAAILGYGYESILDVYARKLGLKDETPDTEQLRWGRRLQVAIAKGFGEDVGREVIEWPEWTSTTCRAFPIAGCTPDATQYKFDRTSGVGTLEIKNVSAFSAKDWEEEVPLRYQIQLQHQLLVMDHEWGTVAGLVGGAKLRWKDYERDDRFLDGVLIPALEGFWACVRDKTPPALTNFKGVDLGLLSKVYPAPPADPEPVAVQLGEEALEKDETISALSRVAKEATGEVEEAQNWIRQEIGRAGAEVGICPNGVRYHWKPRSDGKRILYRREP